MACLSSTTAWANPIDVEQARQAVENFRRKPAKGGKQRAKLQNGDLQYAFTQMTDNGTPAIYVFNTGNGFVLTSADDATTPILGYSDSGEFDPNEIPDGLKYLMGEYTRQITALRANAKAAATQYPYKVEYTTPVTPLLSTRWDQEAPYNNECPVALSPSGRAATGCMTTAIAQIMRFHKWPTTGFGSHEMEAIQGAGKETKVRNYYSTTYNWDAMPLHKSDNSGAGEVSKLMMDVAVALGTTFGSVSSAVDITIVPMLLSYFNYDPSIEKVTMSSKTPEEFNKIVIGDLQAGRPVYFQGGPATSGHAFVCDGYDGEGLFHINWGWSGKSDGYYLVTNLSPSEAGTGGQANAGYSERLTMFHNIKPYQGGTLARPEIKANYRREVDPGIKMFKNGTDFYFGGNFGVYPQTPHERNIRARIGVYVQEQGSTTGTEVWNQHQTYTEILRKNAYQSFYVKMEPSWAKEGTRVSYIYQECGESKWQYMTNIYGDRCEFVFERNSNAELVAKSGNLVYLIEEKAAPVNTVDVTYNIFLNNTRIGQTIVKEEIGKAPSKNFIPDYVNATGFPDVISGSNTYEINTSYNSTMPIADFSKEYNISFNVDGNTYLWTVENGQLKETRNPTVDATYSQNTKWRLSGNWFDGFTLSCKTATGTQYLLLPNMNATDEEIGAFLYYTTAGYEERSKFLLLHREEGFYLKAKSKPIYLAHTQPFTREVYLFNQEGYKGNVVNFTLPGTTSQAIAVEYTVDISGQPEGQNPQLSYQSKSYSNGQKFMATGLSPHVLAGLSATTISGYSTSISLGVNTVYVKYTPQSVAGVSYTVSIKGDIPTSKTPALIYNGVEYVAGSKVLATDMALTQLAATSFDDYVYKIDIKSTEITVTYTRKVNYTVEFSGNPSGTNPIIYYMSQPVKDNQLYAGNLNKDQLTATYIPDHGYQITIDGNKIKVQYYGSQISFQTTGVSGRRVVLKQSDVEVSYWGEMSVNNIYDPRYYTEIKSSSALIVQVVFHNGKGFNGVVPSVGSLNGNTWTCAEGTNSVKFSAPSFGVDATSTGVTVYLKLPDASGQPLTDVNVYIDETGYSTFFFEGKYLKPSGLKVYSCEENARGTLSAVEWTENYIPALTPFVLKGQPYTTYTFTRLKANDQDVTIDNNALKGLTEGKSLLQTKEDNNGADIYVFSRVDGKVGFYKFGGATLKAHKAYYAPSNGADARGFVLDFGEEQTTGIINTNSNHNDNQTFDLLGRRVNANAKGILIINGKKVIR